MSAPVVSGPYKLSVGRGKPSPWVVTVRRGRMVETVRFGDDRPRAAAFAAAARRELREVIRRKRKP